ncbi:MAG: hypothetical protein DWQ07_00315 [Chloroflexi bacterium]|nr:MAG: hypothetical protein DWQ07_00315 [Chloroflexota bacterium]MBL1195777.1 hypothetical protein [Chloroflexota bacterium]
MPEESSTREAQEQTAPSEESQLPTEPQAITFETSDGRTLEGIYYPGAANPSPIIVLMHWAPGTMNDWDAIAPWLQNRGLEGGTPGSNDYLDSTWFPDLPEDVSFGILTFNFSGRGNSEGGRNNAGDLLLDTQAALLAASKLEGVDPQRMAAMGASIGADGSVNGCNLYNQTADATGSCLGALSLSPVDFMGEGYNTNVTAILENPNAYVYCLSARFDGGSPRLCDAPNGENYASFITSSGSAHGMDLWEPEAEIDTVNIFLDFLTDVFEVSLQ